MTPEDRLALADLVHRYAALVDDRRFDDAVELFAEDATLSLPDPRGSLEPTAAHRGHAEIRRAMSAVAAVTRTQHAIVGEIYTDTTQEGAAHGRVSCIAHHWSDRDEQVTADEPIARREVIGVVWHVRYDDEYMHTDAGWRFRSRALTIDAIETRPVRRLRRDGS